VLRAVLTVPVLVLALAAAAEAQEATFSFPDLLSPSSEITVQVLYFTNCLRREEVEVVPDKHLVRVTAYEGCTCPPGPVFPAAFAAEVGRLPAGVYRLEFLVGHRDEASPLDCGPPRLRAVDEMVVSHSGMVWELGVVPAAPRPGEPAAVRVKTYCRTSWAAPEVTGPPRERVIRLIPDDGALRLTPCPSGPEQILQLGALPAGVYRIDVLQPDGRADTSTRFAVAPPPGEAVTLGFPDAPPDRFRVRATWRDAAGLSGTAHPGRLTRQTGYFWFFDDANVEVVVKVIDGCALNSRLWVFLAGLTDVETHVTIEDTATGEVRTYTNPLRVPFAPVQDLNALTGCPDPTEKL
jgi:hypothetical protein